MGWAYELISPHLVKFGDLVDPLALCMHFPKLTRHDRVSWLLNAHIHVLSRKCVRLYNLIY